MSSIFDGSVRTFRTTALGGDGSECPYVLQSSKQSPGAAVISLGVHTSSGISRGSYITRIDCVFGDASAGSAGAEPGSLISFAFQEGEIVERCSLHFVANEASRRAGRVALSFTTNLGRAFQAGDTSQAGTQEAIGGGRLFGFFGQSGQEIDQLGLILEIPVIDVELFNLCYIPTFAPPDKTGTVALDTVTLSNYSGVSQMASVMRSAVVDHRASWTLAEGVRPGTKMMLKSAIPLMSGGELGYSPEASFAYVAGQNHSVRQELPFAIQVELPAMSQVTAEVTALRAMLDIGFTGSMQLRYADGEEAILPIEGRYCGYTCYDVVITYGASEPSDAVLTRRAREMTAALSLFGSERVTPTP